MTLVPPLLPPRRCPWRGTKRYPWKSHPACQDTPVLSRNPHTHTELLLVLHHRGTKCCVGGRALPSSALPQHAQVIQSCINLIK